MSDSADNSDKCKHENVAVKAVEILLYIGTIAITLALGYFIVWIVTVGWVLELIAVLIIPALGAASIAAGYWAYKFMSGSNWMRITRAIILGLAILIALGELVTSHRLVRILNTHLQEDD
jgi:hypothetical protein